MAEKDKESGSAMVPMGQAHPGTLATYAKVTDPLAFCKDMSLTVASFLSCDINKGAAIALVCLCENITPLGFLRKYHMIQGKPSMRADAMLAEFVMNFGGDYEIIERTSERAAIKLINLRNKREYVSEFTWEEALASRWPWAKDKGPGMAPTAANLKDNWSTPTDRKALLWARAVSDGLRAFCPQLVAGVYTPEEMSDVGFVETTTSVVTTAEPKKSALDIAKEAAQRGGAANDAEDAEFEVKSPADPTTSHDDAPGAESGTAAGQSDAEPSSRTNKVIRYDQIKVIDGLLEECWPAEAARTEMVGKIVTKRGKESLKDFTVEEAKELIASLRDIRSRQAQQQGN